MKLFLVLLAAIGGGIQETTTPAAPKPKVPGIRCTCGKSIPFSWATKLIQGENGDTMEIDCFGCGALWHISQERQGAGKPAEPVRRIPIQIRKLHNGDLEVLYRGRPAQLGTDYSMS
jgi:hypothetical protein